MAVCRALQRTGEFEMSTHDGPDDRDRYTIHPRPPKLDRLPEYTPEEKLAIERVLEKEFAERRREWAARVAIDPYAGLAPELRKLRDDLASPDPISPTFDEPDEDEINRKIDEQLRLVDELMSRSETQGDDNGDAKETITGG
jgi:hypothetical protein